MGRAADNTLGETFCIPKKCTFMSSLIFLGFVVSSREVEANPEKVKAIFVWPIPSNVHEERTTAMFYLQLQHHYGGHYRVFEEGYVVVDQSCYQNL